MCERRLIWSLEIVRINSHVIDTNSLSRYVKFEIFFKYEWKHKKQVHFTVHYSVQRLSKTHQPTVTLTFVVAATMKIVTHKKVLKKILAMVKLERDKEGQEAVF